MKTKLSTIFLFIFMIILLGVVGLALLAIIKTTNGEISISEIFEKPATIDDGFTNVIDGNQTMDFTNETTSSSSTGNQTTSNPNINNEGYYYKQLNERQKKLYDGLNQNRENMISGTYTIQFGDAFSDILAQEDGSEILGRDYQSAIDAYIHDNADLFYLDISKIYLNIETTKKAFSTKYNVFLSPKEGQTYFNSNFDSETEVRKAIYEVEQAKNEILNQLTGDEYIDIKMIHDYLVDKVEYDDKNNSKGTYTVYGALVGKRCVCEGYARTLKYLSDCAGIDCVLIQGEATNSSGTTESHAWNAVCIKGAWYCMDVTWDDPIIIGQGVALAKINYEYFLKGTDSFYKDHTPSNKFSDEGIEFTYPTISKGNYDN